MKLTKSEKHAKDVTIQFGSILRRHMTEKKITPEMLSKKIGYGETWGPHFVRNCMNPRASRKLNKRGIMPIENMAVIANGLGVKLKISFE